MWYLGGLYIYSTVVTNDVESGIEWLKSAAENGYFDAFRDLASIYTNGELIPFDKPKAIENYRRFIAAGLVSNIYFEDDLYNPVNLVCSKKIDKYNRPLSQDSSFSKGNVVLYLSNNENKKEDQSKISFRKIVIEKIENNGSQITDYYVNADGEDTPEYPCRSRINCGDEYLLSHNEKNRIKVYGNNENCYELTALWFKIPFKDSGRYKITVYNKYSKFDYEVSSCIITVK